MSTSAKSSSVPWYLWPFWAIWRLLTLIVELTGRLIAVVLGLLLMVIGALVSLTVIGAVLGVPLIIIGFLLVLRGFF
jgi:hypothetical protein